MGIVNLPERSMYWKSPVCRVPFVYNLMTYERFNSILLCLHYVNPYDYTAEQQHDNKERDPFWLVEPFIKKLSKHSRHLYQAFQDMDVDEMCIPFKGRHRSICYNPNKPNKWHFKVFCLNCSKTGYLSNFYLYRGVNEERDNDISASNYPIWKLTDHHQYKHKNHVIYTDNWFTSYSSAIAMLQLGIYQCGTMKVNKVLKVNNAFLIKNSEHKQRGFSRIHKHEDDYWLISGMDNKPVNFLSTVVPELITIQRCARGFMGGDKVNLPCPSPIQWYNQAMGGTDSFDQKVSYYYSPVKSIKWTVRVIAHFLHIACVNAHILFKQQSEANHSHRNGSRLLHYTLHLCEQLINADIDVHAVNPPGLRRSVAALADPNRLVGEHIPCHKPYSVVVDGERVITENRRKCVICKTRVSTFCANCNAYLCLGSDVNNNCWTRFHRPGV